ncbi:hypothetical protein [Nocardia jejuensis]|uniref:hypothetical protein n=1 Tax=Nocardia jejuensis TaxID=328049 RepID=UPI0008316559|nr:hypothetical protein [Nocardia jejuensis]
MTGGVSQDKTEPGLVGVAIGLCVKGSSSADALRPIATTIATALKSTELGERTYALFVSDLSDAYRDQAKIKDADYQEHQWNGKPSATAEQARWQVVSG